MDQFVEGKNPYTILGLQHGQKSSLDEIKKAYRRLALVKHPDKAKTPNAAQEFDELKKAYAILSDKSARAALDEYLEAQAAREARLAQQDVKRQRLREDLERRERQGAAAQSEEEAARARLKVELEALRARAQQQHQQKHAAAAAAAAAKQAASDAAAAAAAAAGGDGADSDDETTQLLLRTVKVTWDPTVGSYSSDRLRQLFSAAWPVEDVILKDDPRHKKNKRKASALVVLGSSQAAAAAAAEVHGDLGNPLLVVPYLKVVPQPGQQQQQQQAPAGAGAAGAGATNGAAAAPGRRGPLFAAAAGRPVQKLAKPLFPGAAVPAAAGSEAPAFSSFTAAASSFPSSFPSGSQFSSFPSFPAGVAGGSSVAVGSSFEDSVLQKLKQQQQQKSPQP